MTETDAPFAATLRAAAATLPPVIAGEESAGDIGCAGLLRDLHRALTLAADMAAMLTRQRDEARDRVRALEEAAEPLAAVDVTAAAGGTDPCRAWVDPGAVRRLAALLARPGTVQPSPGVTGVTGGGEGV